MSPHAEDSAARPHALLASELRGWARELGFQDLGIAGVELAPHDERLRAWLAAGHHGEMDYMSRHGALRWRPQDLVPGTLRVISARMDYGTPGADPLGVLGAPDTAYVARYALGRDYHRLLRARLARLAGRLCSACPGGRARALVDSAPLLERAAAERAGLGWIGKNAMLIHPRAGSLFFLGEILTDIPLPVDEPFAGSHCGSCTACLDACPTQAFVAPHVLDARRCISYLTIELQGSIPEPMRALIGNRVFGCDDCQLVCPWNKFAQPSREADFLPRHGLDDSPLVTLFRWTEEEFRERAAGSPLYRLGHARWLRNLAVALGNGSASQAAREALAARLEHPAELVREHVRWALGRLQQLMRKNVAR